jgi:hypothetical protein
MIGGQPLRPTFDPSRAKQSSIEEELPVNISIKTDVRGVQMILTTAAKKRTPSDGLALGGAFGPVKSA